jgi:hypothetical protein
MSYGPAAALQAAIYQALASDPALQALVGASIYDAVPAGGLPALYVTIGDEDMRDQSDASGAGAAHEFLVSVVSDSGGFQTAKLVAAAVTDALVGASLALARGRLVDLGFLRAAARRVGDGSARRIDLRFRARVEDSN